MQPTPPGPVPAITHEDRDRAFDRLRVLRARGGRGGWNRLWLLWLLIGPGILVMLGENDAPSMLAYSATGAQFGIGFFLPFIVLTFVMAFVVQEMTVRLGAACHRGHAELIFDRFGPFWGWFALGDLLLGNFLTLIAEFIGVRAGLGYFGISPIIAVGGAFLVLAGVVMTGRYWTWERLTLMLAAGNLLFIPIAIFSHPSWGAAGHAFLTWQPMPSRWNNQTWLILVADIGATVTPWMLFFQQGAVVDKGLTPQDIGLGKFDTLLGATLAALAACATIIITAPLHAHPMPWAHYQAAQFAQALRPWLGGWGAGLFAFAIFDAGLLAAIAIATSSAYALGEVLHRPHSLNQPFREGGTFYGVLLAGAAVAAAIVLIPGMPLETMVLIVNVIAVLAMPPALLFLYLLVNDRQVIGEARASRGLNLATLLVVLALLGAGLFYAVSVLRG